MTVRSLVLLAVTLGACQRSSTVLRDSLGDAPDARFRVRLLRSTDAGASWTLDPTVIAHDVTSLHACTYQGEVWIPALRFVTEIPWWESALPSPFVDVLRSRDGVTWRAERVPVNVEGTTGGVDPACVVAPDGTLEMWFAELEGRGDPAHGNRPARIWRTRWNGVDAFIDGEVVTRGPSLIDPSPLYTPDGHLRLFLNQAGARIVEAEGDALTTRWEGVTVPHTTRIDTSALLLAQRADQPQRVQVRAVDGAGIGAPTTWDLPGVRSCESPSLTTLDATWLLFCVDRPPGPPPGVGP